MTIKAMKLALEALENLQGLCSEEGNFIEQLTIWTPEAMYALRTAIETAEKQEPVAWVNLDQYGNLHESSSQTVPPDTFPVYRHPPASQRQWVGLTDRERDQFYKYVTMPDLVKAIEQALKEKNT